MLNCFKRFILCSSGTKNTLSVTESHQKVFSCLFFVLTYLFLWLVVDLRLIHHAGLQIPIFPAFFRGWEFFRKFMTYPGGLVEYASAFLSQLFYIGWVGAIVVTVQAWLFYVCTAAFIKLLGWPRLGWLGFIAPILVVMPYAQYSYYFTATTALLVSLYFSYLYVKAKPNGQLAALGVFLLLSIILYTLAGAAYIVFALVIIIYESLFTRRWPMAAVYLLSALGIIYVEGVVIFGINLTYALTNTLPCSPENLYFLQNRGALPVYMLYMLVPLTILSFGLWREFVKKHVSKQIESCKPVIEILSRYFPSKFQCVIKLVLLACIGVALFLSISNFSRRLLETDYYASRRMWSEVLKAARRLPYNNYTTFEANRALYHTGRLSNEMFSYPQQFPQASLLLMDPSLSQSEWKRIDLFIDLGFLNGAEQALVDSLETLGMRPLVLQRLALVKMAKGQIAGARVYLGALGKTLFHSRWANNYLKLLDSDPNLLTDERIQHLRTIMLDKDRAYPFYRYSGDNLFHNLLAKNKQNQMAFEYLMAFYLLSGQIDKVVANIARLDDYNYSKIPRFYEEAILLYSFQIKKSVDLYGRQISPESMRYFQDFLRIRRDHGTNKRAVPYDHKKHYSDSYLFYFTYGHGGARR